MLGLLIKDFMTLKKYFKTLLFMLAVYAVYGYLADNAAFLVSFSIILFSMVTITSIAYDEQCHWNNYALTMPVSHKTIVLSKYVLGILLSLIGMILSLIGSVVISILNHSLTDMFSILFATAVAGIIIGFLFISIYLPFVFKLGAEKSRIIMVSIFLVPFIVFGILYKTAPDMIDNLAKAFSVLETNPVPACIIITLGILLVLAVSVRISLAIFKKKEF